MIASENGHPGIASLNLDMQETTGFGIELTDGTCIDHMEKKPGCSALMMASHNGHKDVVSIVALVLTYRTSVMADQH